MLIIDGSYGEGGGQIIRTAVAMSAITNKPIKITNIRKNRSRPGLAAQHLTGILAAAELCSAQTNAKLGSTEIEFIPSKIKEGTYRFDVGTAGAVTLVLQTLVPIASQAPKKVELEIIGGTNVMMSPPVEYFQHMLSHILEKYSGIKIKSEIRKYGFYPKGGGQIKIVINPAKLTPLVLKEQGSLEKIDLHAVASETLRKAKVCERMISGFKQICPEKNVSEKINYVDTFSAGASLHAHAHYSKCRLGADALGERGKPAESVGKECARNLAKEMSSGATADHKLADQLIPFMALAGKGEFKTSRISEHLKTNIWVVEKFLPVKFEINRLNVKCKRKS